MRFVVDTKTFVLEFSRTHRPLSSHQTPTATKKMGDTPNNNSTFPYTTVKVIQVDDDNPAHRYVWREATVGCWHKERKGFRLEQGRLHALRAVGRSPGMTPQFRVAMWDAYQRRDEIKKKPKS